MGSILKQETAGETRSTERRRRRNSVVFSDEVEVIGEEDSYSQPNPTTRLPSITTQNVSPLRRKQEFSTKRRRPRGTAERMRNGDTKYDQRHQERWTGGTGNRRPKRLNKAQQDVRRNRGVPTNAMPDIRITDADEDLNHQYGSDFDEVLHDKWMEEAEQQRTLYEIEFQKHHGDSRHEEQLEPGEDEEAKNYNGSKLLQNEGTVNVNEGYQEALPQLQPRKLAWSEEENDAENDFREKEEDTSDRRVESKKQGARERKKKRKRGSRSRPSSRDETDNEDQVSHPHPSFEHICIVA